MDPDLESTTFAERVVLLGVTYLSRRDETPVHSAAVVETCTWRFDDMGDDVFGRISESDVMRTLNGLEDRGLVDEREGGETSPVGKGRPQYTLTVDTETVLDSVEGDDRLGHLAERIRGDDA